MILSTQSELFWHTFTWCNQNQLRKIVEVLNCKIKKNHVKRKSQVAFGVYPMVEEQRGL